MRILFSFLVFQGIFLASGSTPPSYQKLLEFSLSSKSCVAENVMLRRGPAEIRFSGVFYPEAGDAQGAVFIGRGTVRLDPSTVDFERDNVRRMLKSDVVESDFQTAVLRFNDGTLSQLGLAEKESGPAPEAAVRLAKEFSPRLLRQTGVNVPARLAVAALNREAPGIFVAQFDGGRRGRFTLVLDAEGRVPAGFGLNAGEMGLVFAHHGGWGGTDIWQALPGRPASHDLVQVRKYTMQIDLREAKSRKVAVEALLDVEMLREGVAAIPFEVNNGLAEYESERLKKALRVEWVKSEDGSPLEFVQESWESGLTIFMPQPQSRGSKLALSVRLSGEFMAKPGDRDVADRYVSGGVVNLLEDAYYPRSTMSWYPSHGYLQRSQFDLTFLHLPGHKVIAAGQAERSPGKTRYHMEQPVAFTTFAVGGFNQSESKKGNQPGLPIAYFSPGTFLQNDGQTFILTELNNCLQFFSGLFGAYPYPSMSAVVHPRRYGQGFAALLLLPPLSQSTNMHEFSFVAHEMAHQWWGNVVAWRTYRDQWLSEGFAEYSGMLYVRARMDKDAQATLVRRARLALVQPPMSETGILPGKVAELGPITLGLRAATPETVNAYQSLVYEKGALVLRMLHFLLSHPVTGDDQAFYAMLKDFVAKHQGQAASTESFAQVASQHFQRSPLAQKYRLNGLDWFFQQWVTQSSLPSYRLEYRVEPQGEGVVLQGVVRQLNAPDNWFMPLPLVIRFGKGKEARGSVHAQGAQTPFSIPLPMKPTEVVLDPDLWVLSEKTESVRSGG